MKVWFVDFITTCLGYLCIAIATNPNSHNHLLFNTLIGGFGIFLIKFNIEDL